MNRKIRNCIPILAAAAIVASTFLPSSCANTTQAPSGGPKDTIPPFIVDIKPLPRSINVPVTGTQIVFTFNEYVSIKTPTAILLSPPQQKPPKSKIKGKSLVVSFEEDLAANKTYTLTIDNAIADCNENNLFEGYTYVFSTGSTLDSMMISGTVLNSSTLKPAKEVSVMLYRDLADSAVIGSRPDAVARTDAWGYFSIPYIKDTTYRIYAVEDSDNNHMYSPESEMIAFHDVPIRPVKVASDTAAELLKYDMKDTLACLSRKSEYNLVLFKDERAAQFLKNSGRPESKHVFVSFNAPQACVDSIWIGGIAADRLITQFNSERDSLSIWINDRRQLPDTINLFVNYLMTDSLGVLVPETQHKKLFFKHIRKRQRELQKADTTCSLSISANPMDLETEGILFEFGNPLINENFKDVKFEIINARQQSSFGRFTAEIDSLNPRIYHLKPEKELLQFYEYKINVPHQAFRDIYGNRTDSTEFKFSLPSGNDISSFTVKAVNVKGKRIVDLLQNGTTLLKSYTIEKDTTLVFKYLKEGKYTIRISYDENGNGKIDSGSFFDKRKPEKVYMYTRDGKSEIPIPKGTDIVQTIEIQ